MSRRAGAVALLAAALVLGLASAADAHALYRSSTPANGADLERAPTKVVITFTERPDPKISLIQVLDTASHNHARGKVQPVPGQPLELQTAVGPLPSGVYTVTWRTVSEADGHTTAGSFSFGVNVPKGQVHPGATFTPPKSPSPPPLAVAGRWALYWGLALLFAAAVTRFLVFRGTLPLHRPVLAGAWALAVLGLSAMIVAEKSSAGVPYSQLFSSTSGHHLLREAAALGLTTVALAVALVWRSAWSVAVLGAAAATTMLAHALNSHASAESPTWFNVGAQWLHLVAVATWVGGLAWLLIGLRGREDEERTSIARRFSWLAGIALAFVAATGIVRAIDEVGTPPHWSRLFHTSFGVTLLVKLALFAGLVAFGARNHYVNVPGLTKGTRRVGSLRRTVMAEVAIAAGILGATGVLSELAPAASVAAAAEQRPSAAARPLVVSGHDFATSVRVRLTVTPGTVGPNRFRASVMDYDTGRPVRASSVQLMFSLAADPQLGTPSLSLSRAASGTWTGQGTVLSMFGRWDVQALIQEPGGGVQVPLSLVPKLPPEKVQVSAVKGQPTVYTIALPHGGSLQSYLDPGKTGVNAVHFTFFRAAGNSLPIASASATAMAPSGATRPLKLIRFGSGHFVANSALTQGKWTFLIDATPRNGLAFSAYFSPQVAPG